jgi:hypothetical protein
VLRAALNANRRRSAGSSTANGRMVIPLRSGRPEKRQAAPPSRAA